MVWGFPSPHNSCSTRSSRGCCAFSAGRRTPAASQSSNPWRREGSAKMFLKRTKKYMSPEMERDYFPFLIPCVSLLIDSFISLHSAWSGMQHAETLPLMVHLYNIQTKALLSHCHAYMSLSSSLRCDTISSECM